MKTTRLIVFAVLLSISLLLAACGDDDPSSPATTVDPVEEVTETDLTEAGVPGLPLDAPGSTSNKAVPAMKGAGPTSVLDYWGFRVDLASGNLVLDPEDLASKRIVAWALLRGQAPAQTDAMALSFSVNASGNDAIPMFYAVGNYSKQGWEIGTRLKGPDILGALSLRNEYVSPQGNFHMLIVAGHPGTSNPPANPLLVEMPEVNLIESGSSVSIGEHITGTVERFGEDAARLKLLPDVGDEVWLEMKYDDGYSAGFTPVFPADFNVTTYAVDADDFLVWQFGVPNLFDAATRLEVLAPEPGSEPLIQFYNNNELHGARYPFSLSWVPMLGDWNGDGYTVNGVEIEQTASYFEIPVQGILMGGDGDDLIRMAGASITILNLAEEVLQQVTTDESGRFTLDVTEEGQFIMEMERIGLMERMRVSFSLSGTRGEDVWLRAVFTEDPVPRISR